MTPRSVITALAVVALAAGIASGQDTPAGTPEMMKMHEQMGQMHRQMMTMMMGGRGMQPPARGADSHQH